MLGQSLAIDHLNQAVGKVAPTRARVLITGESGTGKELVAYAIHKASARSRQRFVKVNCAAIPDSLIEAELFGYDRGAFTGAHEDKRGYFEQAHGGTLFLDEIADMSLSAQAKVLRVLQAGELARVGSERLIDVDVRVLAATNKALPRLVREGRFREDLYFRLNVVHLDVPPLRERLDDLEILVDAFIRESCLENGLPLKTVAPQVMGRLRSYPWPGNVRELKNVVERMVIMGDEVLTIADLPADLCGQALTQPPSPTHRGELTLREFRDEAERAYIVDTLDRHGWNVSEAARRLGIERSYLHRKLRSLGICREEN